MELKKLITEQRNKKSMRLDEFSTLEILQLMNEEDNNVVSAVNKVLPNVEKVVTQTIQCIKAGGRLIYVGAGTSGRIGVLDAVESPPTFGMKPEQVIGLLAGGNQTLAKEEAEDYAEYGKNDLVELDLNSKDIVIGLAASGRTPYVIGALDYANEIGAVTASVCCNVGSEISKHAKYPIEINNGPEILTGSTRLKAGTSQKMVCNMISTASMVGLGKTYENLMIDVDVSNEKLYVRWLNIVTEATGCELKTAKEYYDKSKHSAKIAICMLKLGYDYEQAKEALEQNDGFVKKVIKAASK